MSFLCTYPPIHQITYLKKRSNLVFKCYAWSFSQNLYIGPIDFAYTTMSVHIKKRERVIKNGRNRLARPKTFMTKDAAEAWAKKQDNGSYTILNLKSPESKSGKFRVTF